MAKDDYHVIVYQILAYLYTQLKAGKPVDASLLEHDSGYLDINRKYWLYIIENLLKDGYISGPVITKTWSGETVVNNLRGSEITPKGIEFLCDNAFLEKVVRFLKDTKAIVPFV